MTEPHAHSTAALWRKLEAEGRLRERIIPFVENGNWAVGPADTRHEVYWTLRLNPDEMERLRYQPRQVHTNLEALGES
jgi:hypothetical protein